MSPLGTVCALSLEEQVAASFYGREMEGMQGDSVAPIVCGKSGLRGRVRAGRGVSSGHRSSKGVSSLLKQAVNPATRRDLRRLTGPTVGRVSKQRQTASNPECEDAFSGHPRSRQLSYCKLFLLLFPSSFFHWYSPPPLYPLSVVTSSRSFASVALLLRPACFFHRYFNQTTNAIKVSRRN